MAVKLQMSTQTLSTGKVVPSFNVIASTVDIPSDGIDIQIHGDFFSQIANWLKGFFMDTVKNDIKNAMTDAINKQLPPQINELM